MPKMSFLQKVEEFWKDPSGSVISLNSPVKSTLKDTCHLKPKTTTTNPSHSHTSTNGLTPKNSNFDRRKYHSSLSLHKSALTINPKRLSVACPTNYLKSTTDIYGSQRTLTPQRCYIVVSSRSTLNNSNSNSKYQLLQQRQNQYNCGGSVANFSNLQRSKSGIINHSTSTRKSEGISGSNLELRNSNALLNSGDNNNNKAKNSTNVRIDSRRKDQDAIKNHNKIKALKADFFAGRDRNNDSRHELWSRDDQLIGRLEEERHSSSSKENQEDTEDSTLEDSTTKMRWQKSAGASSSATDKRPKSFDYSQRKAWMKYYREMEVSKATPNTPGNKSKAISKGSISHLHLLDSKDDLSTYVHDHPNPEGISSRKPPPTPSADHHPSTLMTPSSSLFQRFSKTFSLRFGSSSSVNKLHVGSSSGGRKVKDAIGSSPDLHSRLDGDAVMSNGKMRKGKSKSIRGEKCQSGDSGIGIEEPQNPSRLRRIRSELIEQNNLDSNSNSSRHSSGGSSSSSSALGKMSLVEIPNWEEDNRTTQRERRHRQTLSVGGPLMNTSYEDILEAKLDGEDDGFLSDENPHENATTTGENPNASHYPNYHSLPHKNSRKNKSILQRDQRDENNHQGILTPSGRSKSLEDEQQQNPTEDNSIRGKVIREIIFTEQNYVKTLNDIVQGFLNPCRRRNDLFSGEIVRNIFSNIEDILRLHARFLEAMKERINPTMISGSNVGAIFTEWADHFEVYSEYCCNNPISNATVRSLMQTQEYTEFFEACRRLQLMDKLPLHGFLLRPIQRICQYHLQLNELLKQTEESHEDYPFVVEAVETMKSVALKINDTQRQFDYLQEIIRLQNSIEAWEGYDLLSRNSAILVKGDLVKTTMGKRNKEVSCILLNKDLVYCKKDFIRKGGLVFDGKIDLEVGAWLNIDSNEEDEYFGMVHNSWRIFSPELKTWILFTAPSPIEKRKWIAALEKSVDVRPVDKKMRDMAKLITILSDERPHQPQSSYSSNSNTLPKSSKKYKGKHSSTNGSNGKIDADAMLIEVSKLKRSNYVSQPLNKERSSRFYV